MPIEYDKYYQTENLFGEPYRELIAFYAAIPTKGKLLDVGCGQGRDAIALARLGYEVTGIDHSRVGVDQLNQVAQKEGLPLEGRVEDIYEYIGYGAFDFILLDSMFHFGIKEKEKEVGLLRRIIETAKPLVLITICIQKMRKKLQVLNAVITKTSNLEVMSREELIYQFEDKESGHSSETVYEMVTIKKLGA